MAGDATACPDCGAELPSDPEAEGLCPQCLLSIALVDPESGSDDLPTMPRRADIVASGEILGERYQIRSLLGRGGMGEVWRAFDLKLRVDVALKALRPELLQKERARELLRGEVRSAREVVSPQVCRVFDLVVEDGHELVSMEYVDGTTLEHILRDGGPLELSEAREIASQFLSGLEAIHQCGLVHRDFKPENVMVTRAGRVVVMDFGIAKGLAEESGGTIAGTPAYMAPEQARGDAVDARADVFSAGVVLAEMTSVGGPRSAEARQALWHAVRKSPPGVPDVPWANVLAKALAFEPEARYGSARELSRALSEIASRLPGDEEKRPYPGLAAFTEEDAEFFFGRELEVESVWKKLKRPHLLALIGPSGNGKSSFLRAGLLPTLPDGWSSVLCTPGNRPFQALARTLVPAFAGDTEATELLLHFDNPDTAVSLMTRWRERHDNALLVIDQFEELFTQNPPEAQQAFARLLGRLVLEGNVHVLLSLRDDFLFYCNAHEALAPIFSELTPLGSLSANALRRALVQPALACGYLFEDEALVEDMVAAVGRERGALPLLAFAASRLWEKRDREAGLLTRQAYEEVGGVSGALAQHAEATLETIGTARLSLVREVFRNLVTAQGTRASRPVEELLSVFADGEERRTATEVLETLIGARLLIAYERAEGDDGGRRHVEIIHESLLAAWPRLVRWQTQDADGAQLRDQLRQAAQMWEEKSRPDDLLWTGTSFKEYELWRERYSGGLTTHEEAFAAAMAEKASRRRRQRRLAVATVVALAIGIATVTSSLWQQARVEARRAEASKLLALAQLRHQEDPTEALAYTTASLELADTLEARVFAVRLLREAPPALELEPGGSGDAHPAFSPDGSRLAVAGFSEEVRVWTADGENSPIVLTGHEAGLGRKTVAWASNELIVTGDSGATTQLGYVWRLPGGERERTIDVGEPSWLSVSQGTLFAATEADSSDRELWRLRSWRLPDGEQRELGLHDWPSGVRFCEFMWKGRSWLLFSEEETVHLRPLPAGSGDDQLLGRHARAVDRIGTVKGSASRMYSHDRVGETRVWDFSGDEPMLETVIPGIPDPTVRWAVAPRLSSDRRARVWNLEAWSEARPLDLRRSGSWYAARSDFHPSGDWLVVSTRNISRLTFWPLRGDWPWVVDGYDKLARPLAFSPDGRWLATSWADDALRLWPLPGSGVNDVRTLDLPDKGTWWDIAFDPSGRFLVVVGLEGRAFVVPVDGSPPRRLVGFSEETLLLGVAVSPSGRRVASAFAFGQGPRTLRVWELDNGESRLFELPEGSASETGYEQGVIRLTFVGESTLYTSGDGGVRRWNLESGTHELVLAANPGYNASLTLGTDGLTGLVHMQRLGEREDAPVQWLDLRTGATHPLPALGAPASRRAALNASVTVAAVGDREGVIRVGRLSGGEPHLLMGHEGPVNFVAFSGDGRWVASTGQDNTLRLWPMPDLSKPPLHALAHDELITKLKSSTNFRVVPDPDSAEGWKLELDAFPGWKEIPELVASSR